MDIEFRKYILKKYGVSILGIFKNTVLIGKVLEVDMVNFIDTLDKLDVLLRIKKQPKEIDNDDIKWLTEIQKTRLNELLSDQKKIFAKRV